MENKEAIEMLERFQNPEPWEPQITSRAYEALEMAIAALKKQEQDRWIPVTERLPEDGERVLITYWKNVIQATWDEMRGCFFNTNAVLLDIELIHAWRPLPEAYTEEEA